MWLCHSCGETGRGGCQAVVTALEAHLRARGHQSGSYSYGGPAADRERVTVTLAGGKADATVPVPPYLPLASNGRMWPADSLSEGHWQDSHLA